MKVSHKTAGGKTFFLVSELDPPHQKAANDLGFVEADEGFGRVFEANTPHLDQIFARFASSAEEMILQASGVRSVPWDKALLGFLERTSGENVDWWLAGSAALAIRGIDLVPRDLDIITDGDGALKEGGAIDAAGCPALLLGGKGIFYMELRVRSMSRDAHSGQNGRGGK